jgi:hypothetical protein
LIFLSSIILILTQITLVLPSGFYPGFARVFPLLKTAAKTRLTYLTPEKNAEGERV